MLSTPPLKIACSIIMIIIIIIIISIIILILIIIIITVIVIVIMIVINAIYMATHVNLSLIPESESRVELGIQADFEPKSL